MSDAGTGIDPKVDYVFKQLCADEDRALVLVDVINAVVDFPAGRRTRGVTIKNPFVAKEHVEGKVPILDVRASDDPGRQFILEMQQFARWGFTKRLLYYWAGCHAEQLLKGERYETLQPTYAICFVNQTLFPDANYHHRFVAYDKNNDQVLCPDLEIHVLEINKFDLPVEEVKTPRERWCYFFKHGASLDPKNLPATLSVPAIHQAMEVLVRIGENELERQRYLEQQRIERDAASLAADAREARMIGFDEGFDKGREKGFDEGRGKGFDEGRGKGFDEGREKGQWIGRIQLLQQLLAHPKTSSEELGRLPEAELEQLEESLKRQLSGPKPANGTGHTDKP